MCYIADNLKQLRSEFLFTQFFGHYQNRGLILNQFLTLFKKWVQL